MNLTITHLLETEARAVLEIPAENDYAAAAALIRAQVAGAGGKVVASGIGKAGLVAGSLASTFSSTGTQAVFLHPSEAQHGDLGLVHPHDVYLLISNSGKTRELLELAELSLRLHGPLPIIVITSQPDSPLAQLATVTLLTGNPPEVCPLGLTPTTSITVMHVIGHILTVLLMQASGFDREAFLRRHHGGYLGAKLRSAARPDPSLPAE